MQVISAPECDRFGLDLCGMRHALRGFELGIRDFRVPHDRESLQAGDRLAQELDLLRTQLGYVEEETGDISAGPRQRLDPARSDGIGLQIYPDDRHRCLGL